MIKLYFIYFILGFYIYLENILAHLLSSFGPVGMITFISSAILFSAASGLALYYVKIASIIGLACLVGAFPFGIHWLSNISFIEAQNTTFQICITIAIILYLVGLFYSLKIIINYKKPFKVVSMPKLVKLGMACVPILLFLWCIIFS